MFAKAEPVFKHVQGEGFTPTAIVFVLEMVFPIPFGNTILPK